MAPQQDYTPQRPDYSQLAPLDDEPEEEVQEASKNATAQAPIDSANSQAIPIQPNNGSVFSASAQLTPEQKNDLLKDKTVFTAPEGQQVAFASEVPGGIKGVADKDSYLFITEDVRGGALMSTGWRAFVVSKDDPHKQREISLKDVDFDTINRHEFHAKLGHDHDIAVGISHTTIDGKSFRNISSNEDIDRLVKQRWDVGGSMYYSGDSWVIMRKDFETGRIEKFTQSSTSNLGRLEIIQGDPVSADKRGALSDSQSDWLENGETKRQPQSTSSTLVPLPDSMKKDVAARAEYLNTSSWKNHRMAPTLERLVDVDAVKAQTQQENKEYVATLNAEEHQKPRIPKPPAARVNVPFAPGH